MTPSDEVERYLTTGEHDPSFSAWPGGVRLRRRDGEATLRRVLARVVEHRVRRAPLRPRRAPADAADQVRHAIEPLITGLLPDLRSTLLEALPHRVEVVTPDTFAAQADLLPLDVAWSLANLLLDDMGVPPLADDIPALEGVCAAGRAWVLPRAFDPAPPFVDVLVHEVAHLLHDLQRGDLKLSPARRPLVEVPLLQRETFAYACEIWSCILREAPPGPGRVEQVGRLLDGHVPIDFRIERPRLIAALQRAASEPGDGWQHIAATAVPCAGRLALGA